MKLTFTFILLALFTLQTVAQNASNNNRYLLVIDIQNHFTHSIFLEDAGAKFVQTINSVIEKTDPGKVIYVESIVSQLAITLNGPQAEFPYDLHLDKKLKRVNNNIIIKKCPNVFKSKQMIEFVEKNTPTEFVVIGLAAEHCVLYSLLGGQELGYNMSVIPAAIAGTTPENKKEALQKMQNAGIKIQAWDSLL